MYKIAVVDDERIFSRNIKMLIEREFNKYKIDFIIDCYSDGQAFLKKYFYIFYDIVFMDIYLSNVSGFEIISKVPVLEDHVKVIFITSDATCVYDCFEFNPFDFVHKEISEIKLPIIIKRILETDRQNSFLQIKCKDTDTQVKYSEILYIQSDKHNVKIVTFHHTYCTRGKIKEYEAILEMADFIQIHRKNIVNLRYIEKIDDYYDQVIMRNGTKLEMSRYLKAEVKSKFMKYC